MERAPNACVRANKLEELRVYQRALEGIDAVSPILQELLRCRDYELHKQLSESSGRIPGHIGEGFGQGSDRQFANYLCIARGSAQESRGHIAAASKKYPAIQKNDEIHASGLYEDLTAMLTAFIDYLRRSDFRNR
jgi:four helix bundle protein